MMRRLLARARLGFSVLRVLYRALRGRSTNGACVCDVCQDGGVALRETPEGDAS